MRGPGNVLLILIVKLGMDVVIKADKDKAWRRKASSCNVSPLSRFLVIIDYTHM